MAFAAQEALGTTEVEVQGRGASTSRRPGARIPLGAARSPSSSASTRWRARATRPRLRGRLEADGVDTARDKTWAQLVDHMLSHYVEPNLIEPTFLVDYPVELSPLARRKPDDPSRVERFEAFCGGMEIANGFSELNDPDDQLARFEEQARAGPRRRRRGAPGRRRLRHALRYGMPPTGGVGHRHRPAS